MRVFENRVLRKTFGLKEQKQREDGKKLHIEEQHDFLLLANYYSGY
jgi:hypothetical protein